MERFQTSFSRLRDEENKLTEEGKKIQKSLQSVTDNVSKMTKEARMSGAMAAAGEFAGDVARDAKKTVSIAMKGINKNV